jgi:hypothetical protein
MVESLKAVLIRRDGMSEDEADILIEEAKEEFDRRIEEGDSVDDLCEEYFGLEPDYLEEFF